MSMGVVRRAFLVLALVALSACGTGDGQGTPPFEISAMGPAGGVVAAGDVAVNFPAGAFTQPTQVSILPELNPLPFVVDPQDPCMYAYLGPLWCVGPVGHNVFVPSVLTVFYDPGLLPPGRTEDDLVLFAWDDAAQVMRLVPGAVQDQAENKFTFNTYIELGHLAIMVRTCQGPRPNPGFGFIAGQPQLGGVGLVIEGGGAVPGLYVADADADLQLFPPVQIPTNTDVPDRFAPSRDGMRILYVVNNQQTFQDNLFNVTVAGGTPIPLAVGVNLGFREIEGWWGQSGGSTDVFFQNISLIQAKPGTRSGNLVDLTRDEDVIDLQAADGLSLPAPFHGVPDQDAGQLLDVRQAPNDAHLIVRYIEFPEGSQEFIETVNATTGALVGTQLPVGGSQFTPRFNAAGDGVVFVSFDRQQAIQTDLAGGNPLVLYDVMSTITGEFELLDFAPAPDGVHFFAVVRDNFPDSGSVDRVVLGTIDGGGAFTVLESQDLGEEFNYEEIVWHPDSRHVYLAMFSFSGSSPLDGVVPFSIDPAAAAPNRIIDNPPIPAGTMSNVDVNVTDGRLLVTIPAFDLTDIVTGFDFAGTPSTSFTAQGIWVSAPDGTGPLLVIDTLDDIEIFRPARWLRTFRNTSGFFTGVR